MQPNANTPRPQQPTPTPHPLTSGPTLPPIPLALHHVDSLLVVIEHGSLPDTLTTILSAAALYRAISEERGTAPALRVTGAIPFSNALKGFGEYNPLKHLNAGEQAVFLSAASFYRKELAQMIGSYALSGGTLHGTLHSVDDSIPLGKRDEPLIPVRRFVQKVVGPSADQQVHHLLALAEMSEGETTEPTITAMRAALTTLQRESLPFRINRTRDLPQTFPTIQEIIQELAIRVETPLCTMPLIERHKEALQIAQEIWENATEIAPGIFQLHEIPYAESDVLVDGLLKELYNSDPRADFVLERGTDRPATGLAYDEALTFERRLGAGEAPEDLLAEISTILQDRRDSASLTDIELADMRDRDQRDTLERILEKSQYLPDPSGVQFTLRKSPADLRLVKTLEHEQIPMITHNALWLCNLKTGEAEPIIISFQAQHLERFIGAFARQ